MIIFALVGGALGLIVSLALRRDTARARSLRTPGAFLDERFVFLSLPSFSFLLLGFGLLGLSTPLLGGGAAATLLGVVLGAGGGALALLGIAGSVWGLFSQTIPPFAFPKWMRRRQ